MPTQGLKQLIETWNGLAVICRFDRPTGTWIFVALHDDTLGMPLGGTRIKVYSSPAEGLRDAMRLAEGMTHKWATIDLGFGGGKAVLAVPRLLEGEERDGLLESYGRLLSSLRGGFGTGVDLGSTPRDMAVVARYAEHVFGVDQAGRATDPGPFTAHGVFTGMKAALEHRFGSLELSTRRVLIQGVGGVGSPLARLLFSAGAELSVSDLDGERANEIAAELGATVVPSEEVFGTPCDVFAPCAVGAVLNQESIPLLRCAIVAGAANNQLEEAADADRLHRRGILYAPDYVINAGGAMAFALLATGVKHESELRRRVGGLGDIVRELFREAATADESPLYAAQRRVERVLARNRREKGL